MKHSVSRLLRVFLLISIFAAPAWAVPVELNFTNAELDLGNGSVVVLAGNEYAGFGISVSESYRYIDGRDPFSDAPDDVGTPCANENASGRCNFGLANDDPEFAATIDFLTPQSNVSFDWWTLGSGFFPQYTVFDQDGNIVVDFSPASGAFGTVDVPGLVSSIWFSNALRGFSQIANLRFGERDTEVPEPSSILLLSLGLVAIAARNRRRS